MTAKITAEKQTTAFFTTNLLPLCALPPQAAATENFNPPTAKTILPWCITTERTPSYILQCFENYKYGNPTVITRTPHADKNTSLTPVSQHLLPPRRLDLSHWLCGTTKT